MRKAEGGDGRALEGEKGRGVEEGRGVEGGREVPSCLCSGTASLAEGGVWCFKCLAVEGSGLEGAGCKWMVALCLGVKGVGCK